MPPFSSAQYDATGNLWVEQYAGRVEGETPVWSVFSPEGEWINDVRIPANVEILGIGRDHIIGVNRTGNLASETVLLLKLLRRNSAVD